MKICLNRFLAVFLLGCILSLRLSGAVLYVSPGGNDETGERGNPERPFRTIQKAFDLSESGDQVLLSSGEYLVTPEVVPWYDPLPEYMAPIQLVGKSHLTLEGESGAIIVHKGAGDVFTLKDCTNIVVQGIRFQGDKPSVPTGEREDGKISPLLFSTIHFRGDCDRIKITDCVFDKFGNHAISHLWSPKATKNVEIYNCTFTDGGAVNVHNLVIDGAAVSGIGSDWKVHHNVITECQRGLEIECISKTLKKNILLSENTLTNMYDYGIMLFANCSEKPSLTYQDITISSNILQDVHYGILITGGDKLRVISNKVDHSEEVGIGIMSSFDELSNLEVFGNRVSNCNQRGIQVVEQTYDLSNAHIHDNYVEVTGNSGILVSGDNIMVEKNECRNCGWTSLYGGIEVNFGTRIMVCENNLYNRNYSFMKYGIIIRERSQGVKLFRNRIVDPVIDLIYDLGEETDYGFLLGFQSSEQGKIPSINKIYSVGLSKYKQKLYISEDMQNWTLFQEGESDEWGEVCFEFFCPLHRQIFFRAEQYSSN